MKCPNCRNNHKKKFGQRCPCGYRFALNPLRDYGYTDGKFLDLIRTASGNDTFHFTENQLYRVYCKKTNVSRKKHFLVFFLGAAAFVLLLGHKPIMALFDIYHKPVHLAYPLLITGLSYVVLRVLFRAHLVEKPPPKKYFDHLLMKWQSQKGKIEKLVRAPALHQPPEEWKEDDIYDYGVERILIVEKDRYVDLLVKNEVHAMEKMLICSLGGYPGYLLERFHRIVARKPDIPVFLLHDGSLDDDSFRSRLAASPLSLPDSANIIDLGLDGEFLSRFKHMKHYPRDTETNGVPLDYLTFPTLQALLTTALARGIPFREIVTTPELQSSYHDGSGYG
jgi:hypothetical protein